jgi:8-oxo-dGTP diphosphatase
LPIPGVGALIIEGESILLVRRGKEPLKGWWSLPGGVVEAGETLEFAVRREVREETGLEIDVLSLVEIFERITLDETGRAEYHYILIDYLCRPAGGTLLAATDAAEVRWVREEELPGMQITEGTPAVIAKAFELLRAGFARK